MIIVKFTCELTLYNICNGLKKIEKEMYISFQS